MLVSIALPQALSPNMKTIELHNFGLDNLRVVRKDEPKPSPGQLLVRVRAVSLNYRDLMIAKGQYNPRMKLPVTPLSDAAGDVADTGEGAGRFKIGDRVCPAFMPSWIDGDVDENKARSALGGGRLGVASEYVAIDESALVAIPDHLSYEEASTLPCAAVTAWNALVTTGHVRPGEHVLTQGTGGVSVFALQFAKLMHARVTATSGNDAKLDRVRSIGAEETINYRETPDWDLRARELTNGRGVDHVVEVGGAGTLPKSLKAVRMGGTVSLIGVLAGAGPVDFVPIFMRSIRVHGIFVGSRDMFEDMNRAIAAHQVRPVVDRIFPVEDIGAALRYMESGAHFGKICCSLG
jgi:NADPH:quinone reductase-like Zn-dependent oxidoreductase